MNLGSPPSMNSFGWVKGQHRLTVFRWDYIVGMQNSEGNLFAAVGSVIRWLVVTRQDQNQFFVQIFQWTVGSPSWEAIVSEPTVPSLAGASYWKIDDVNVLIRWLDDFNLLTGSFGVTSVTDELNSNFNADFFIYNVSTKIFDFV